MLRVDESRWRRNRGEEERRGRQALKRKCGGRGASCWVEGGSGD